MAFPIVFVWFVIALLLFRHHLRKSSKAQDEASKAFWSKEESSLVVRKKELDADDFVKPNLVIGDLRGEAYYHTHKIDSLFRHELYLKELIQLPMVNFSHLTNTDLRLQYGTAMLPRIEEFENNYTAYINTLYKLAKGVWESGDQDYAIMLLEEGLKLGTDSKQHILLLATIYLEKKDRRAFDNLYNKASKSESLTKKALLESLDEMIQ